MNFWLFIFNTYDEYIEKDVKYTYEKLIEKAKGDVAVYEKSILGTESVILDRVISVSEEEKGIKYKVTYSIEENIGDFVETGEE